MATNEGKVLMEVGMQLLQLETGLGAQMAVHLLSMSKPEGGQGRADGWMAGTTRLAHLTWRDGETTGYPK